MSWMRASKLTRKNLLKMIAMVTRLPPRQCVDRRTGRGSTSLRMDLHGMLCNFIALKRAIRFFDISLFDPVFVDCIVFDKDTTHYSTSKFHDIHSI